MRTDLSPGPRTWLLAGLAGWCLAAWVLAMLGMGGRVEPLASDPSLVQPLPRLPADASERLGALSQYGEISARPLFSSDRRPKPFFITGEGGEPTQAFDFVLSSVMIAPGVQLAILQPTAGGESIRLQIGESPPSMSNWQLVDVQPRSASFAGPEGPRTLELRVFDGAGGQGPTAMTASPVPPPGPGSAPPMAGPGAATARQGATGRVPPVALPGAEPGAPAGQPSTGETADPTGQPSELTTQQQMDAIRQRIEARRAQLRQAEQPSSSPNHTQ